MSEWQLIETAPKDCALLLAWPQGGVSIGRWKENPRTKTSYFSDTSELDDYEIEQEQPTHWMPLPKPPRASTDLLRGGCDD